MPLNDLDYILFSLNALAYIMLFAWYWHQDRHLTLRTFITMLYAGSAIFAPYVFNVIDPEFYGDVMVNHVSFWPFCYLLAMFLLLFSPLLHSNIQDIKQFEIINSKLLNIMTWGVVVIYAITILSSSIDMSSIFSPEMLLQNYAETYNNTIDGFKVDVSGLERYTSILKGATTDLVILLLAYNVIKDNKIGIIAMAVCMGYNVVYNLSVGQRAVILEVIFSFIFIYLVLRNAMSEKTRRKFYISFLVLGLITVFAFGMLTFARFSDRDNSIANYVLTYYSESWYIFNSNGLDPGGCRYGDFTSPLGRLLLGKSYTKTMFESIDTFTTMTTNCAVFNTVVGDFTMDFTAIWTAIIFAFYALFMHRQLKDTDSNAFPFAKLIIIIIAWRIVSLGFIAYSYRGIGGNLQIVTDILLYLILKREYEFGK